MWQKSENSERTRPQSIEYSGNIVIVRRDFREVEATGDREAHWEWTEWQMTKDQYEVYQTFEIRAKEQEDALVELAGLISEVV